MIKSKFGFSEGVELNGVDLLEVISTDLSVSILIVILEELPYIIYVSL